MKSSKFIGILVLLPLTLIFSSCDKISEQLASVKSDESRSGNADGDKRKTTANQFPAVIEKTNHQWKLRETIDKLTGKSTGEEVVYSKKTGISNDHPDAEIEVKLSCGADQVYGKGLNRFNVKNIFEIVTVYNSPNLKLVESLVGQQTIARQLNAEAKVQGIIFSQSTEFSNLFLRRMIDFSPLLESTTNGGENALNETSIANAMSQMPKKIELFFENGQSYAVSYDEVAEKFIQSCINSNKAK